MLHIIIEKLNSMNDFSKKIIKGGCTFSFILCAIGVAITVYNQIALNKIILHDIGTTMAYTAIVAFAQFVIGGLLIDFFGKLLSER